MALIAVNDSNPLGNHDTIIKGCETSVEHCGYIPYYEIGAYTTAQIDAILTDKTYKVVVITGHGDLVPNASNQVIGTLIYLDENDNSVKYRSTESLATLDLSHLDLVIFLNCYSAYGGASADNLPSVAVERGAKTAIGFELDADASVAATWLTKVFEQLKLGMTISEAISETDSWYKDDNNYGQKLFEITNIESHVICGDPNTKLTG